MKPRIQIFLLGAAGGALAAAGWLPLGLSPLFPLLLVPVFLGLRRVESGRDALALGLGFGLARYAVAGHFLLSLIAYSPLAFLFYLFAVLYVVPFALMEACGAFWLERRARVPRWLGFAALFALGEYLRTIGDLSFPADLLAHGLGPSPAWMAWASWFGPYHVSLLILLLAALTAEALWRLRRRPARGLALFGIAGVLWLLPAISDVALARRAVEAPASVLRVGIVQHCATVHEKHDARRHGRLWQRLERLTRRAARNADLVVWPEAARPGHLVWNTAKPLSDPRLEALAAETGVPILYGTVLATTDGKRVTGLYNGAVLVQPDAGTAQWYGKQRLLPFAERFPFAALLGWDPAARRGGGGGYLTMLGNFSPGPSATIFEVGRARIGVLICYEGFYERLARRYRADGANLLLTLTNDSWWGGSVFPHWHARMASARAQELDLPVVRAATNGISSATDRHGRLIAASNLDSVTVLSLRIAPTNAPPTFFARTGNLIIGAIAAGLLAALLAAPLRPRIPALRLRPPGGRQEVR